MRFWGFDGVGGFWWIWEILVMEIFGSSCWKFLVTVGNAGIPRVHARLRIWKRLEVSGEKSSTIFWKHMKTFFGKCGFNWNSGRLRPAQKCQVFYFLLKCINMKFISKVYIH